MLTEKERVFLDALLCENQHITWGPATKKLWSLGVSYSDITGLVMAYQREGPKPHLFLEQPKDEVPEMPWTSKEGILTRDAELRKLLGEAGQTHRAKEPVSGSVES